MKNVIDVANYIAKRYRKKYGRKIDEMKLHKLMYFAQRESYIRDNKPLFDATFYGWRYGPVLKEVRRYYGNGSSFKPVDISSDDRFVGLMDQVFSKYAAKDSWSLSRLTHGELSWKNSRIGIPEDARGDVALNEDDIKKDAERIRIRRAMFG